MLKRKNRRKTKMEKIMEKRKKIVDETNEREYIYMEDGISMYIYKHTRRWLGQEEGNKPLCYSGCRQESIRMVSDVTTINHFYGVATTQVTALYAT